MQQPVGLLSNNDWIYDLQLVLVEARWAGVVSMLNTEDVARMCLCEKLTYESTHHEQTWGLLVSRWFANVLVVIQDLKIVPVLCVCLHLKPPDPLHILLLILLCSVPFL